MKRYITVLSLVMIGLSALLSARVEAVSPVHWAEINPELADANYVSDVEVCKDCHEDYIEAFKNTKHGKIFAANPQNDLQRKYCEACHGPLSKHIDAPRKPYKISLKVTGSLAPEQRSAVCLQCHEKGVQMHWRGSRHEMAGVGCGNCHYLSERRSDKSLLIHEDSRQACFQCHKEKRAQMMRSSHMPIREGKVTCVTCHNPHGGPGPALLKTSSVNETCYGCHAEKRGPLLWEHSPVRELCTNCHEPHGSNFPTLLKIKVPYLCQTCHMRNAHPSELFSAHELADGTPSRRILGKGCLNCHSQIHGSNHPSGTRFER